MPRTRSLAWSELKIGLMSVFALFIATAFIFLLTGSNGFFWQRYSLKARFNNVAGLATGSPVRIAGVEMHPMDCEDRTSLLRHEGGIGMCNITKCCTEVCPEDIHITDNAIIPLKERVVDKFYDPITMVLNKIAGKK